MNKISRRKMLFLMGGSLAGTTLAMTGSGISFAEDIPPGPFKLAQKPFSWTPKMQGKTIAGFGKSDARKTCGACHDKDKESPILKGKMDCTPCHSGDKNSQNKFKDHPLTK